MKRKPTQSRQAFTLIEVLVVVAIIALLISILLPSLASAKEQARMVACGAGLQQMGRSLTYCFNEYKAYPAFDDGEATSRGVIDGLNHNNIMATWIDVLFVRRYLGDFMVGYCPKDAKPDPLNAQRGTSWNFNYPPTMGGGKGADYSYGISVVMSSYRGKTVRGLGLDKRESSRVMASDSWWIWMHGFSAHALINNRFDIPYWGSNTVGWRHGTVSMPSAQFLFRDGSVRMVRCSMSDRFSDGSLRGVSTSNQYFWRSGEHTNIGGGSPHNGIRNNEQGNFPDTEYPYGENPPNEIDPDWYSLNSKWPASVIAHKGWKGRNRR